MKAWLCDIARLLIGGLVAAVFGIVLIFVILWEDKEKERLR